MIRISAPTRLHFGLLHVPATGSSYAPYGGLGAMVDTPRITVTATPADTLTITGTLADRARQFAEMLNAPPQAITADGPPEHLGLGVGTALGLAMATALRRPLIEANRGLRSQIGVHGFQHGGFLFDGGHGQPIERWNIPAEWRFLLMRVPGVPRWHGDRERAAFARTRSAADADRTTRYLLDIVNRQMKPALAEERFEEFAAALGDYNRAAGEPFAEDQGGPFVDPTVSGLIARIRERGYAGAGQTSWGPTVFVLVPNAAEAEGLKTSGLLPLLDVSIAKVSETGAFVQNALPIAAKGM